MFDLSKKFAIPEKLLYWLYIIIQMSIVQSNIEIENFNECKTFPLINFFPLHITTGINFARL